MNAGDAFAVLGQVPTLNMGLVKKAYFAALAQHPPHQDPAGFRRIRDAYEQLTRPNGLAAAYLASPPDLQAELARYEEQLADALALVTRQRRDHQAKTATGERFAAVVSRLGWAEVIRRFGETLD